MCSNLFRLYEKNEGGWERFALRALCGVVRIVLKKSKRRILVLLETAYYG